jgi:hypothetical protein
MNRLLATLLLTIIGLPVLAQTPAGGLRGSIRTAKGEPLPYAAVVVKNSTNGTITNAEGRYELPLPAGRYEVVFQYLGFQTQQQTVTISSGFEIVDVVMTEQVIQLREFNTKSTNEDPAYTIMRRAIAKSRFHELQVNSYTARVYGKGVFMVDKIPKLVEQLAGKQLKEMEQEANFKVGVPNVLESVAEVSFQQPNTYRRRIIASRNSQTDRLVPSSFSMGSFYRPEINNAVSPLSPKAFGYYKFVYEGTFREAVGNGQTVDISKIRVTPQSWGEGVFRGVIYIIENTWALHSLQLEQIARQGLTINLRQTYSPVQSVWMPLNGRFSFNGDFFGVKISGNAVVSYQYRNLNLNPAFAEDVQVVDEKKIKPDVTLSKRDTKTQSLEELMKNQKEFSTKNLRQLVREYEKREFQERKKRDEDVTVVRNDSVTIDSLAGKRSAMFWDSLRSVPLTNAEIRSYVRNDSLKIVREVKFKTDSLSGKNKSSRDTTGRKFYASQLLAGATWRVKPRARLTLDPILSNINYSTVEGYYVSSMLRYDRWFDAKRDNELTLRGDVRYQFGRQQVIGLGEIAYRHKTTSVSLSGGRYVYQYNPNNPIGLSLNSNATLLFEQNLIKLYQKDRFLNLTLSSQPFDKRVTLTGSLEMAQRSELANFREDLRPWFNWRNREFTPNRPDNIELANNALMPTHNALTLNLTATGRLGSARYAVRNGVRRALRATGPTWLLNYRRGLMDIDYDFVQAGLSHSVETGIRSRLSYSVGAGAFLTNAKSYLPDFAHFQGNEFFLQQGDPVTSFRLLPYYRYSTGKRFAEGHALMEFRQLLLTQIIYARLAGLKEDIFVHYLATPDSKNYAEVGYALDGLIPSLLPIFRLEVIGQFQDFKYQGLGFRVGTTLRFGR